MTKKSQFLMEIPKLTSTIKLHLNPQGSNKYLYSNGLDSSNDLSQFCEKPIQAAAKKKPKAFGTWDSNCLI